MPRDTNTNELDDKDRMAQLLRALVDVDPTFLPFLGEVMGSFGASPWPPDLSRYVFGPLIVHSSKKSEHQYGEGIDWLSRDIIKKYKPRVYAERVELANGERPDLVSPTELWMVMYNATMYSPLAHPLTDLYVWAVHRSLAAGGFNDEAVLRKHHADCQIISDDRVFDEKSWTHHHTYRELCGEIRRKVIAHSKYRAQRGGRWKVDIR